MLQANFYTETRTKTLRCDFSTVRRAPVPAREAGEGGGARASGPTPRRERLVHGPISSPAGPTASPRPLRLPSLLTTRMNQPWPGARPPRFLFSFSTPLAPGAARLHHRGFPGTLPLTPLAALAAAWPLLSSLTRSLPTAKARPRPPPPPSPKPQPRPPHRLAGASPRQAQRRSL